MSLKAREGSANANGGSEKALLHLLNFLKERSYAFVTPTPATHGRVLTRAPLRIAGNLRDVFGWNLSFHSSLLPPSLLAALNAAGMLEKENDLWRARVRVSSLHTDLYLHSPFPTDAKDAVFFGPDSYRFADLIISELRTAPLRKGAQVVDIGTGSGVGAIVAGRLAPGARITMTDINPLALKLAGINLEAAGCKADLVLADDLDDVPEFIDLAVANPPYLVDDSGRQYRDGGEMHGAAVSLSMAEMALARLAPEGRLILYTGSAIVNGEDVLRRSLFDLAARSCCSLRYREIDPDVFGEELEREAYRDVERISVVSAVFEQRPACSSK